MTAGFVYVVAIEGQPGRYKIGYSVNPDNRLAAFQTGHYDTLTLTRRWPTTNMERDEQRIHAALSSYQRRGEWFECSLELIETTWAELTAPDPTFGRGDRRVRTSSRAPAWLALVPYMILTAATGYLIVLVVFFAQRS